MRSMQTQVIERSVEEIDVELREIDRDAWSNHRPGWTEAGWWDAPMLPEVRRLMSLPKGADLLSAVQLVPQPDGSACSFPHRDVEVGRRGHPCVCQVIVIAAWATAATWAQEAADAAVLHALGAAPRCEALDPLNPSIGTITDPGVELVAPALRRSPDSMRRHVYRLRDRNRNPESIRAAIGDGFLPAWQADLIMQDLTDLDEPGRDLVVDTVVDILRHRHARGLVGWTFTDIRRRARQVRATLGLELQRRREGVRRSRQVVLLHGDDGWARITADLPADVAHRIMLRLEQLAQAVGDEDVDGGTRTADQKRADVFSDLLLHESRAAAGRAPAEVAVVIDHDTLLGCNEDPAEIPGMGPVPAQVARELAADRRWRAWITDASGVVVATSPSTYVPTAPLARLVRAREPHCRMPGCRRTVTDLDHVIPFPRGRTTPSNIARLCRRHHNLKTHLGWQLVDESDATGFTWVDPNGVIHLDEHDPPLWDGGG